MEIEIPVNTGNFGFTLVVEPNDKVMKELLIRGIKTAIQPTFLSWEKSIAYPDQNGKKVARPKGFVRKDIPFSAEAAKALEIALATVAVDVEGEEKPVDIGISDVKDMAEYTGAEAAEPKYKRAKDNVTNYLFEPDGKTAKKTKAGSDRTLETFVAAMASRGLDLVVPTEPWTEDKEFLKGLQDWLVEEDKKKADSMD